MPGSWNLPILTLTCLALCGRFSPQALSLGRRNMLPVIKTTIQMPNLTGGQRRISKWPTSPMFSGCSTRIQLLCTTPFPTRAFKSGLATANSLLIDRPPSSPTFMEDHPELACLAPSLPCLLCPTHRLGRLRRCAQTSSNGPTPLGGETHLRYLRSGKHARQVERTADLGLPLLRRARECSPCMDLPGTCSLLCLGAAYVSFQQMARVSSHRQRSHILDHPAPHQMAKLRAFLSRALRHARPSPGH